MKKTKPLRVDHKLIDKNTYGYGSKYENQLREGLRIVLKEEIKAFNYRKSIKIVFQQHKDWVYLGWSTTIRGKRIRKYPGHKVHILANRPEVDAALHSIKCHIKELLDDPKRLDEATSKDEFDLSPMPEHTVVTRGKPGLHDRIKEWIATYTNTWTRRNALNFQYSVMLFELWKVNIPVESISRSDCERFYSFLKASPVSSNKDPMRSKLGAGRLLDLQTAISRAKRMKAFFNWCVRMEYIKESPASKVKLDKPPKKDVKSFSLEELGILAKTPTLPSSRDMRNAFLFCSYTGMRKVDAQQITYAQLGDYDPKTRKYFPYNVSKFSQHKTKNVAHIALNEITRNILMEQWNSAIANSPDKASLSSIFNQPVFAIQHSTRLSNAFAEWLRDAGIRSNGRTFRHARHSCGTNLYLRGASARDIQLMLGHSSLQYTERYMGHTDEHLSGLAERLTSPTKDSKRA